MTAPHPTHSHGDPESGPDPNPEYFFLPRLVPAKTKWILALLFALLLQIVSLSLVVLALALPTWGFVDGTDHGHPTNVFLPLPVDTQVGLLRMRFDIAGVSKFNSLDLPYDGGIGDFCGTLATGNTILFIVLLIQVVVLAVAICLSVAALALRKYFNTAWIILSSGVLSLTAFILVLIGFAVWATMWHGVRCEWPPGYYVSGARTQLTAYEVLRPGWAMMLGFSGSILGGASGLVACLAYFGWVPRNDYLREKGVPECELPDPPVQPIDVIGLDTMQ